MNKNGYKIGFSEFGGIYVGKGIQSNYHRHYAITILLSFGKPFKITTEDQKQDHYKVALIQKNIAYKLQSNKDDYLAFIHIVPYSNIGQKLSHQFQTIQKYDEVAFESIIKEINDWFKSVDNDPIKIEYILESIASIPNVQNKNNVTIDPRVRKSFDIIMTHEDEKISINQVAKQVHVSASHFAHLFKKETGMTFRQFALHSKLIKSIFAMYKEHSLTEASFLGGFADQSHFTRTFKNAFGIKPSTSRK